MNAVNSVQLFLLVWTFTAVCRADEGVCSVSCKNVTGTVGEEVTLICSVPQQCSECCIIMYKFQHPEKYDSTICREDLPQDSCEQRNSFTCRYTSNTAVPGPFRFMAQTKCETLKPEVTVNITDVCSVSYEDVTETVGKEATFTCSVPQKRSECCIIKYKIYYTEIYKDYKVICRQDLPEGSCDQRNNFTCRYTPTTAMTGHFRFFVQTKCGWKDREFTVDITEPIKPETVTETPEHLKSNTEASPRSNGDVVPAVTGCFIILILILILTMTIIYKTKSNYIKPCGFQKSMFLCLRHDEENDNSNCPENAINNTDSVV